MIRPDAPFGALLPASSVVLATLYVAGFAYRWSYYFNFGLQNIVYEFSLQAILMTAIELIRPAHLPLIGLVVVLPFAVVSVLLGILQRVRRAQRPRSARVLATVVDAVGIGSPVVGGAIKAIVLIGTTYMLGSHLGYVTYTRDVANSADNPLPVVTALLSEEAGGGGGALACGAEPGDVPVIGDAASLRRIQEAYRTCTGRGVTWRLLHRDKDVIFLFASEPADHISGRRPLTIVLPAASTRRLILQ
jgi:hypothetical protein